MRNVVFKMASDYRQWFYHELDPGRDYVLLDSQLRWRLRVDELPSQLGSLDASALDVPLRRVADRSTQAYRGDALKSMSFPGASGLVVEWWNALPV